MNFFKACFIRRILVGSNAIQTIDNETIYFIRRARNATYKTGLIKLSKVPSQSKSWPILIESNSQGRVLCVVKRL